jgi:hypothetical protein
MHCAIEFKICQTIKLYEQSTTFIINTNKNERHLNFTKFPEFCLALCFSGVRNFKFSYFGTSSFRVSQFLMSRFTVLSDSRSPMTPFYVLTLLSLAPDSYDHAPRPWSFPSRDYSYRSFGTCVVNRRMSSQPPIL